MSSMYSSCRNAEKNPSSANLDDEYGATYGCAILPEKHILCKKSVNWSQPINTSTDGRYKVHRHRLMPPKAVQMHNDNSTWSWHQHGKPFWVLIKQEMMRCQWHQLDHVQIICTSLQTDNHASTSSLKLFIGRMLFLTPNQQHQSTEDNFVI